MRITPRQYAEGVYESVKHAEASDRLKCIDRFLALLVRDRRRRDIPIIFRHLERIAERELDVRFVDVLSAQPLTETSKVSLEYAGKKLFGGKKVHLRQKTQKVLLGGALLRTENETLDMSISGRFGRLARFVRENI